MKFIEKYIFNALTILILIMTSASVISLTLYFWGSETSYSKVIGTNNNFGAVYIDSEYKNDLLIGNYVSFRPSKEFFSEFGEINPTSAFLSVYDKTNREDIPLSFSVSTGWTGEYNRQFLLYGEEERNKNLMKFPFNKNKFYPPSLFVNYCGMKGCINFPVNVGIYLENNSIEHCVDIKLINKNKEQYFEMTHPLWLELITILFLLLVTALALLSSSNHKRINLDLISMLVSLYMVRKFYPIQDELYFVDLYLIIIIVSTVVVALIKTHKIPWKKSSQMSVKLARFK